MSAVHTRQGLTGNSSTIHKPALGLAPAYGAWLPNQRKTGSSLGQEEGYEKPVRLSLHPRLYTIWAICFRRVGASMLHAIRN